MNGRDAVSALVDSWDQAVVGIESACGPSASTSSLASAAAALRQILDDPQVSW